MKKKIIHTYMYTYIYIYPLAPVQTLLLIHCPSILSTISLPFSSRSGFPVHSPQSLVFPFTPTVHPCSYSSNRDLHLKSFSYLRHIISQQPCGMYLTLTLFLHLESARQFLSCLYYCRSNPSSSLKEVVQSNSCSYHCSHKQF